jgi:hypothetical protein
LGDTGIIAQLTILGSTKESTSAAFLRHDDVSAVLGHNSISITADIYDTRTTPAPAMSAADQAMQPEDEQNDD